MEIIDESPVEAEIVLKPDVASPKINTMSLKGEPSPVPAILISDASIVEHGTNKRSVIGCYDQFTFPLFPAPYGRFFITAWITNLQGKLSELEVTCRVEEKSSGHVIFSNSIHLNFQSEQTFEKSGIFAMAMGVPAITFPTPGTYTIVLLFDGEKAGERDFNVLLKPQQQLPPQQS